MSGLGETVGYTQLLPMLIALDRPDSGGVRLANSADVKVSAYNIRKTWPIEIGVVLSLELYRADDVRADDVGADDVGADDVRADEVRADDVRTDDVWADGVKADD
ncbi:hypothetical protein Bpfe_019255, partial [Biomphalaria pfeifferi]